jgi:hypothetical protein
MRLRTECDVVKAMAGAVTLEALYQACVAAGVAGRDGGLRTIPGHGSDVVFKRRVRNALQSLKRVGKAYRVTTATWVIDGTAETPRHALLLLGDGEPAPIELLVGDVVEVLGRTEEAFDLIFADPPWALSRQAGDRTWRRSRRVYARNAAQVVPGYQDVSVDQFTEFTSRWVVAAAAALRPGAYLAVVTGPQQAARVQVIAEDVGKLTYVNQLVVRRPFPTYVAGPRRFSHAHLVITVLCAGPLDSRRRFFAVPDDLPKAASGRDYPRSWWDSPAALAAGDSWDDLPRYSRPGLLRYETALPPLLVRRVVHAFTPGPENGGRPWQALVADPFLGGGTTAVVCFEERRRFLGGDTNRHAVRFTAARVLVEHAWPAGASGSPVPSSLGPPPPPAVASAGKRP